MPDPNADAGTRPEAENADRDALARIGRKVRRRLSANKAVRRVEVDKAEMWYVPRFFDPVECGRLMASIDAVAQPSKAYEVDYATGYRTSYSGNLDPFDSLVRSLQGRIDALLGSDADWENLPPEVVLQLHWRRDPGFVERLSAHGFRVVTVARHPLDVLISILHFCVYESESEHWLLGAGGSEAGIYAAMPRSRAFVEYATGPRAAGLLAVTPDWWGQPGVVGHAATPAGRHRRVARGRLTRRPDGPLGCVRRPGPQPRSRTLRASVRTRATRSASGRERTSAWRW